MAHKINDSHNAQPLPSSRPATIGRVIKIALGGLVALVLAVWIVNQITPVPFVLLFRQLTSAVETQGQIGPYADQIARVGDIEMVSIPVEGAPDAGLTIYLPPDPSENPRPMVLFIHGGGWVIGSAKAVSPFAKLLASEGYVVANLDYSLAPEHKYPTPIRQSAAAIDYLVAHADEYGADPSQLFIAGNSAGAQLASQLGAMITNPTFEAEVGIPIDLPAENLKGVVLYSGPYDFDTIDRTNFPGFRMFAWSYTGQKAYESYPRLDELSTVRNATPDYPPTYMTTGDADQLEPQTYELDAILRALGVDVTSRYWTGSGLNLPHDYIYELDTEAAQTALEDVVQFLRDKSS